MCLTKTASAFIERTERNCEGIINSAAEFFGKFVFLLFRVTLMFVLLMLFVVSIC